MSEAHADHAKPRSQDELVEFRVPARLESLVVVRTLVSALGTLEDLDLDAVADLRLALDEACTRLIRSAAPDSTLVVEVEPRETDLRITVSTTCVGDDILRAGTFSWHVISSLTDDVQTFRDGPDNYPAAGGVFGITMIARRLEADR